VVTAAQQRAQRIVIGLLAFIALLAALSQCSKSPLKSSKERQVDACVATAKATGGNKKQCYWDENYLGTPNG
jgi:hypothetical protein